MRRASIISGIFLLAINCNLASVQEPKTKTVTIDTGIVQKDLSHSTLGANAQQFRSHYSINNMLRSGQFDKFMQDIGRPILRIDGRSIYGWFSKDEELQLKIANRKLQLLDKHTKDKGGTNGDFQPGDFEKIISAQKIIIHPKDLVITQNHPDICWFDPVVFHEFCRKNKIQIIGAINDSLYYDSQKKEVFSFRNKPEFFQGAVEDFKRKLSWVIDHGYKDLYVAWEIGNECWGGKWNPEMYAEYAKEIINAGVSIQPDIKLAVPVMIRNTDDPWIKTYISQNPRREKCFSWHEKVLPALGADIKKVTYLQIHVYGFKSCYSANYNGFETMSEILAAIPNTEHLRFLVTEWRYTGVGGSKHRTFNIGALNNAKFAMTLISHPRVDYSTAHEFLLTSGLGYWTPGKGNAGAFLDGSNWVYQKPEDDKPEYKSTDGKPSFDIGPFGPVNKILNEIIGQYPLLVAHESELGKMSSALFAEDKTDLEWLIAKNHEGTSLGGCVVNTQPFPVLLTVKNTKSDIAIIRAIQLTCQADKITTPEIPGEKKFWKIDSLKVSANKILIAPQSITSFEAVIK